MNIQIIGNGAFGSFLREWLSSTVYFEVVNEAHDVILAVPISAYREVGLANTSKHLINVCSVQRPSTDILLNITGNVTSIHPLFGARTPPDKRRSILTRRCYTASEDNFLQRFSQCCPMETIGPDGKVFTVYSHDELMFKTHYQALMGATMLKQFVDRATDVPDEFIPQSFRLMREFVKTMEDMPAGTVESILANPFAKQPPHFQSQIMAEPWAVEKEPDAPCPS